MKFTIKTTLESVSFAGANLRDEALGGLVIECKTTTGRHMRDLAPFFGNYGAVRVTFEADEPVVSAPIVPDRDTDTPHGALVPHPANVLASKAVFDDRMCVCPATSEYDPPCPKHGVVGIGITGYATAPAPPVVSGHPSCCRSGSAKLFPRWIGTGWMKTEGGWFTYSGETRCEFCPFCGAKMPEVPR